MATQHAGAGLATAFYGAGRRLVFGPALEDGRAPAPRRPASCRIGADIMALARDAPCRAAAMAAGHGFRTPPASARMAATIAAGGCGARVADHAREPAARGERPVTAYTFKPNASAGNIFQSWGDPTSWAEGTVPDSADADVDFPTVTDLRTGQPFVSFVNVDAGDDFTARSVQLRDFLIVKGSLTVTGELRQYATGEIDMYGGTLVAGSIVNDAYDIQGNGQVTAGTLVNDQLIIGSGLTVRAGTLVNGGTLAAGEGGLKVIVGAGGLSGLAGGTLSAGTLRALPGGTLSLDAGSLIATDGATISLEGGTVTSRDPASGEDVSLTRSLHSVSAGGLLTIDTASYAFDRLAVAGTLDLASGGRIASGGLAVDVGGHLQGSGTVDGAVANEGVITAGGLGIVSLDTRLVVNGAVNGGGSFEIAAGSTATSRYGTAINSRATLELNGATAGDVVFDNGIGILQLDQVAGFTGTIAAKGPEDRIILSNVAPSSILGYSYAGDARGGTLTLQQAAGTIALDFVGSFTRSSFGFTAGPRALSSDPESLQIAATPHAVIDPAGPQLSSLFLPDFTLDRGYGSPREVVTARVAVTGATLDHVTLTLDRPLALADGTSATQLTLPGGGTGAGAAAGQALQLAAAAASGSYAVTGAVVVDAAGRTNAYDAAALADAGISTGFAVADAAAADDGTRPYITAFVPPANIATSQAGTAATFLLDAFDVGKAGYRSGTLTLDHALQTPDGPVTTLRFVQDGSTYSSAVASLTLPVTSATPAGTYRAVAATVTDAAGNTRSYGAADLVGLAPAFTVDDRTAPTLTSLRLSPVDVTNGDAYVAASATASDAAGNAASVTLTLDRPVVTQGYQGHGVSLTGQTTSIGLAFADQAAATASGGPLLDTTTRAGSYTVARAVVTDAAGNSTAYSTAQLAALGFDTVLAVTADTVAPTLTAFALPASTTLAAGSPLDGSVSIGAKDGGVAAGSTGAVVHFDRAVGPAGYDLAIAYVPDGQALAARLGSVAAPYGSFNVTGITLTDRAGNVTDYRADQLRALGYATSFDVTNPAALGTRHAAASAGDVLAAPIDGQAYFEGHGGGTVVLNGNVGDYLLSRVQPTAASGATGGQVGAFLLTATNGSGAYAIEESIATVQFRNGQYLSLRDLPAYVAGSAALAAGGGADDLLFQDPSLAHQLFVGGDGSDRAYLNGNVGDYTLRSFAADTPREADGTAGSHHAGLELVARNGSGALLIDGSVETVQFRNGQYLSYRDIGSYVAADADRAVDAVGIAPDGEASRSLVFAGAAGPDRVLLNGTVGDYVLSRDAAGDFVLTQPAAGAGPAGFVIGQAVDTVRFGNGQYLSLRDLPAFVRGDGTFTAGTGADDLLVAAYAGDQYLVGGDGRDDAYLHGNTRDYAIRRVDADVTPAHPAIHGYELVAANGSGNLYVDGSTETVHFQDGQYLAFADLPAYIDPYQL